MRATEIRRWGRQRNKAVESQAWKATGMNSEEVVSCLTPSAAPKWAGGGKGAFLCISVQTKPCTFLLPRSAAGLNPWLLPGSPAERAAPAAQQRSHHSASETAGRAAALQEQDPEDIKSRGNSVVMAPVWGILCSLAGWGEPLHAPARPCSSPQHSTVPLPWLQRKHHRDVLSPEAPSLETQIPPL